MKLTENAIQRINNKRTRTMLALTLDFTERWISRCIEENKANGPLTTIAALGVIRKETGLSDRDLLEKTEPAAA